MGTRIDLCAIGSTAAHFLHMSGRKALGRREEIYHAVSRFGCGSSHPRQTATLLITAESEMYAPVDAIDPVDAVAAIAESHGHDHHEGRAGEAKCQLRPWRGASS